MDAEQLKQHGATFMGEMANLINTTDGWKIVSETNGVKLEARSVEGSDIEMTRCTKVFDNLDKFETFVQNQFSSDLGVKQKAYVDMVESDIIQEINENNHVTHTKFNGPTMVAARDFVMLKSRQVQSDGSHLITACSIDSSEPVFKGCVRGEAKTGMLITPLHGENKIKVVKVDHVRPKGWIPPFVLNWLKGKSVDNVNKMEMFFE